MLVSNWKEVLGHYSTIALGAVIAIPSAWLSVPEEVKVLIPQKALAGITIAVGVAGFIGKLVAQGHPKTTVPLPTLEDTKEVTAIIKDAVVTQGKEVVSGLIKNAITKALK